MLSFAYRPSELLEFDIRSSSQLQVNTSVGILSDTAYKVHFQSLRRMFFPHNHMIDASVNAGSCCRSPRLVYCYIAIYIECQHPNYRQKSHA